MRVTKRSMRRKSNYGSHNSCFVSVRVRIDNELDKKLDLMLDLDAHLLFVQNHQECSPETSQIVWSIHIFSSLLFKFCAIRGFRDRPRSLFPWIDTRQELYSTQLTESRSVSNNNISTLDVRKFLLQRLII